MCLWAEALDIAHATRMKLISDERLCRGVTACGRLARGAFHGTSERHQHESVRLICQMSVATRLSPAQPCGKQGGFMKFLDWLKPKKASTNITFTTQIVVNKAVPRTDLPEFCVDGIGEIVNLWPFAAEVLADYPEEVAIDVDALARLAVKGYNGRHIKAAEYPPNVDRDVLNALIWRVQRWSDWPRRFTQLQNSAKGAFPMRQFHCDDHACDKALAMREQVVPVDEVLRLPLNGCWGRSCRCDYRLVRKDGQIV